jgi:hypothetical protein
MTQALPRTRAWPGRVLVGLVVGILVLVLPSAGISQFAPDVPSMIECVVMHPPQFPVFGLGESPVLSPPEACQAAGMGPPVSSLHDNLARDDCAFDGDDPMSLPVLGRGALSLPPPSTGLGVTSATSIFPWPFSYLARPQLLTRP